MQQASFTAIDNDTRRVDKAGVGAVAEIDSGTRGTYYFDAFEARRESYIGPANGAPQPPPFPEKTDALFTDNFESGNLSAWSGSALDGGDMGVTTQAAITGTYGLQAVIDDNNSLYVVDWRPYEETRYRARFYFDPNSITMASGNAHYLFYALNRDDGIVARLELQYASSTYQVRAAAVNDASAWNTTAWTTISDAPHYLEFDWQAASAAGANDGALIFWVDGTQAGAFTAIDNDTRRVDKVRLGAVAEIDNGTRGTYYFDAFESRRETYIGQASLLSPGRVVVAERRAAGKVLAAPLPAGRPPTQPETASRAGIPGLPLLEPLPGAPAIPLATLGQAVTMTIAYAYDPLYRLARADYGDGTYFAYTYDAVGNRLAEGTAGGTVNASVYDAANRLVSRDGVPYTWDANGNLLSDGVNTYTYNHANRLVSVSGPQSAFSFEYNGQGDRVAQTVNNLTTHYTLDLAGGLTQVLADGPHTYLYGAGRIAQYSATATEYFLGDALGSVRQLADGNGEVALAKSYQPFGETLSSAGDGESAFAFTGEAVDSTGLVYLRARYLDPAQGRFISRDTWEGDDSTPISYNRWLYGFGNPIKFGDPSGYLPLTILDRDPTKGQQGNKDVWANSWNDNERAAVERSAFDVGTALARTINENVNLLEEALHRDLDECDSSSPWPFISPNQAFLLVYHGPVTFMQKPKWQGSVTNRGYFATTQSGNLVWVWKDYTENYAVTHPGWIVHELGHAFEQVLSPQHPWDSPGNTGLPADLIKRRLDPETDPYNEDPFAGFKGGFESWTYSKEITRSEIFADMFLGWVYKTWARNRSGKLTPMARQRSNHMNNHMDDLILKAMRMR